MCSDHHCARTVHDGSLGASKSGVVIVQSEPESPEMNPETISGSLDHLRHLAYIQLGAAGVQLVLLGFMVYISWRTRKILKELRENASTAHNLQNAVIIDHEARLAAVEKVIKGF